MREEIVVDRQLGVWPYKSQMKGQNKGTKKIERTWERQKRKESRQRKKKKPKQGEGRPKTKQTKNKNKGEKK